MKAIVANRLLDGDVVFWSSGQWVESLGDAQLFGEGSEAELDAAVNTGKGQPTVVVDVYPIDLAPSEGHWAPVSYRERMRALGPTNEPTHGKQAEGGDVIDALRHAVGAARSTGRVDLIRRK